MANFPVAQGQGCRIGNIIMVGPIIFWNFLENFEIFPPLGRNSFDISALGRNFFWHFRPRAESFWHFRPSAEIFQFSAQFSNLTWKILFQDLTLNIAALLAHPYDIGKVGILREQKWLDGLQMVQFKCPSHSKPSASSSFEVGWIFFSHYWPSGVIRNGLPVWKWKSLKILRTKVAQRDVNGPVWMSLALKPLCLIQFWSGMNSLFPLLAPWGNKNWPPSMKVKMLKIF